MHVEIRSHNIRMPRAHRHGLAQQVRPAFARLAHRIDGDVMVVRERQRRLGPLLRRALQRAWRTAAAAVISRSAPRPSSPSDHPSLHHQ
jgi:hypothetical protein